MQSLSFSAVQVLQPSVLHFSFAALAPPGADDGAHDDELSAAASADLFGPPPCLKDLSPRLQQLGLCPPSAAGAVWGLRVQPGACVVGQA